jgi:hypothetical protein
MGYVEGRNLLYVEEQGAKHNEPAWGARFPACLAFLLRDYVECVRPQPDDSNEPVSR